tara:strand:+ start:161 stop:373 length:213 start_codon:yes stop_codon:yes gene_type:complete
MNCHPRLCGDDGPTEMAVSVKARFHRTLSMTSQIRAKFTASNLLLAFLLIHAWTFVMFGCHPAKPLAISC